jgi:hypothetical protein
MLTVFLTKPVDFPQLKQAVTAVIDEPSVLHDLARRAMQAFRYRRPRTRFAPFPAIGRVPA